MPAVLDVSKPTPLRLFGFLFTAVGGVSIALGSLQTWATVGVSDDRAGVLDTAIPGIDRAEGKATLAMGVAILVAQVALRIVGSHAARRIVALLIVVCAAGSILIGALTLADAHDRFDDAGTQRIVENISADLRLPIDEARRRFEQAGSGVIEITVGIGLWIVVGGGALGLVGGLLDLAWVGQQRLQNPGAEVDTAP